MSTFRLPVEKTTQPLVDPLSCKDVVEGGTTCMDGRIRFPKSQRNPFFKCPRRDDRPGGACQVGAFLYPRRWATSGAVFHYHQGIDIFAKKGTSIYSVVSGDVYDVVNEYKIGYSGFGRCVVIRTRDYLNAEHFFLHAHCDKILVVKGQPVSEGMEIATVGVTCFTKDAPGATFAEGSAHVHFEVSRNPYPLGEKDERTIEDSDGTRLDPLMVLRTLGPWGMQDAYEPGGTRVNADRLVALHQVVESSDRGGYFPLGMNNLWHGGVHIPVESGALVHAPLEGEVIAARLDPDPDRHAKSFGSTNFILIRHRIRDDVYARIRGASPTSKNESTDSEDARTVYCLLMHLGAATVDEKLAKKVPWLSRARLREESKEGESGEPAEGGVDAPESDDEAEASDDETSPEEGTAAEDVDVHEPPSGTFSPGSGGANEGSRTGGNAGSKAQGSQLDPAFVAALAELTDDGTQTRVVTNYVAKVRAGEPLWIGGSAAGFHTGAPSVLAQVHWEIFSKELIFPDWQAKALEDTSDDITIDVPNRIYEAVETRTDPGFAKDRFLTQAEIAEFFASGRAAFMRRTPCRFRSEWGMNLSSAVQRIQELNPNTQTTGLEEAFRPYVWWDSVKAELQDFPDPLVWHYNPIEFAGIYQEHLNALRPKNPETHATLIVRVLNRHGATQPGVVVVLTKPDGAFEASAETSARDKTGFGGGEATFYELPVGPYEVMLQEDSPPPVAVSVQPQRVNEAEYQTPLEGPAKPVGELTVSVQTHKKQMMSGVSVELRTPQGAVLATTVSGDGSAGDEARSGGVPERRERRLRDRRRRCTSRCRRGTRCEGQDGGPAPGASGRAGHCPGTRGRGGLGCRGDRQDARRQAGGRPPLDGWVRVRSLRASRGILSGDDGETMVPSRSARRRDGDEVHDGACVCAPRRVRRSLGDAGRRGAGQW